MSIALVLAGGMAKGAYQAGALAALSKYIPYDKIDYISAASIGTLNGAYFSCGKIDDAVSRWRSVNKIADSIPVSDFLKSSYLKQSIQEISQYKPAAERFFFPIFTINKRERQLHYIDLTKEDPAERRFDLIRASIAVPVLSRPVVIDGQRFFDGAIVDNMPVTPIRVFDDDIDFYIAIYFDSNITLFDTMCFKGKTLKICFDDGSRFKNATLLKERTIANMVAEGERQTDAILKKALIQGSNGDSGIQIDLSQAPKQKVSDRILTSSRALTALNGIVKHGVKYIES